jgi:hypothetical protein
LPGLDEKKFDMIIVNYYQNEDYNPQTDGYTLELAAVVNDTLSLTDDIELIIECLENAADFTPKNGVVYEVYLDRALVAASFPASEPAFSVNRVVEKQYSEHMGHHTPLVQL